MVQANCNRSSPGMPSLVWVLMGLRTNYLILDITNSRLLSLSDFSWVHWCLTLNCLILSIFWVCFPEGIEYKFLNTELLS